jgi:hypothetical protein
MYPKVEWLALISGLVQETTSFVMITDPEIEWPYNYRTGNQRA